MDLTAQQQRAISDPNPVLQLVACAGSGKTEVLARRIVRELGEGIAPGSIVAFTFTSKAASELKDRVERRSRELGAWTDTLPPTAHGLFVGTIHSYALELLRGSGGRYETYDILPEERQWALALRYARRLGIVDAYSRHLGKDATRVSAAPVVTEFLYSLDYLHNERIPRKQVRSYAPELARAFERYEALLDDMCCFSFGTCIDRACDSLQRDGPLRRRLQGRIKRVFVDEYQDLNVAQEQLLGALASMGAHVTVVGDDDQAIYQWRGGNVELFRHFTSRYAKAKRLLLADNYRSRASIVATAAVVSGAITDRLEKQMEPARQGDEPAVEVFHTDTAEEEAATVVKRIQQLLQAGHAAGDIAILFRSVRTSAQPYIDRLRAAGIEFRLAGRLSLLTRPEMALLARLFVLWAGGVWYPDGPSGQSVTEPQLASDLADLLHLNEQVAKRRIRQALALREEVVPDGYLDLVDLLNQVLVKLGLPGEGPDAGRYEQGIGQFSSLLAEFEHAQRQAGPKLKAEPEPALPEVEEQAEDELLKPADERDSAPAPSRVLGFSPGEVFLRRLKAFLEAFSRRAVEENPDSTVDNHAAVQLMTVHASKGLEFPVVFVPALTKRRFPSSLTGRERHWLLPEQVLGSARSRYEGRVEDEHRLFYVALTRAKELLVLSYFEKGKPSPFLEHLKPALRAKHVVKLGEAKPKPVPSKADEQELSDVDFGALSTYDECGFKYRLRYLCGFAPPIAAELGFGKILHHLCAELARAARAGEPLSKQLVDKLLDRDFYLPFAGVVTKDKLRNGARRRLHAFLERNQELLSRTIEPEFPFELPLANARVHGRIDLLARAEKNGDPKKVVLVDYKTTEKRPPPEVHKNQLRLYAEACRSLGYEPVGLEIHDLREQDGGRLPVQDDAAERDRFRDKLNRWVDGIHQGRFDPCEGRKACRECDFKRFCRYAPGRG